MVLYNYILQQEYLQKPIWNYVIEGSKNLFFGLWPTYLPNPWSSILMPKPPCNCCCKRGVDMPSLKMDRECHRFVNPCGSTPQVRTGTGTGWGLVTLAQPAPVVRAPSGHSGFCT